MSYGHITIAKQFSSLDRILIFIVWLRKNRFLCLKFIQSFVCTHIEPVSYKIWIYYGHYCMLFSYLLSVLFEKMESADNYIFHACRFLSPCSYSDKQTERKCVSLKNIQRILAFFSHLLTKCLHASYPYERSSSNLLRRYAHNNHHQVSISIDKINKTNFWFQSLGVSLTEFPCFFLIQMHLWWCHSPKVKQKNQFSFIVKKNFSIKEIKRNW